MKCNRCGTEEDRIHGYCSVRCEELHEVEQENERLLKGIRKSINDLEDKHNQYLDDVIENLKALEK